MSVNSRMGKNVSVCSHSGVLHSRAEGLTAGACSDMHGAHTCHAEAARLCSNEVPDCGRVIGGGERRRGGHLWAY